MPALPTSSSAGRYTATAITLHWLIALLLLGQFAFGFWLGDIPRGTPARGIYVNLHKSTGILIGLLILLRIGWRLTHAPPPLPLTMPAWQRLAARTSHLMLYLCMLSMPLSGYLGSNFSRHGIKFFNAIFLPPWGPDDKTWYALFNRTHQVTALVLAAFVILHLLAVAKHVLIDRDRLLLRMWPGPRQGDARPASNLSPETRRP
jgi:cytochrome b561